MLRFSPLHVPKFRPLPFAHARFSRAPRDSCRRIVPQAGCMTGAEVISLGHRPLAGTNMLLVKNLSSATSPEKLHRCLCDCGLIDNLNWDGSTSWATVQFFSRLEAETCARECDGRIIDGNVVRVAPLASPKASAPAAPPLPLTFSKASEVMSHFLGFSGWSHQITQMRRVSHTELRHGRSQAEVEVGVRVLAGGLAVERTAGGKGEHAHAAEAVGQALKAAVTNALKETLSTLAIYRRAEEPGATPVATVLVVRRAEPATGSGTAVVDRVGGVGGEPP